MAEIVTRPTHAERCRQEATRDVIFLFQRRTYAVLGAPEGYETDDEGRVVPEGDWNAAEVPPAALTEMTLECSDVPCAIEHWHTERVFLTRAEGESYGAARAYNYRHGWRVYGVCAEGELAELLRKT